MLRLVERGYYGSDIYERKKHTAPCIVYVIATVYLNVGKFAV